MDSSRNNAEQRDAGQAAVTALPSARPAVRIDWCPRDRASDVQRFIDEHWRSEHILSRDLALLTWQYRHPDDPDRLSILVAEHEDDDGDTFAGMLGLIHSPLNDHGRLVPGAMHALWLARPAYRRGALGLRLQLEAMRRRPFIGTLGANESARAVLAGLRYHVRPRIERWARGFCAESLKGLLAAGGESVSEASHRAWFETASSALDVPTATDDGVRIERMTDRCQGWRNDWNHAWRSRFAPSLRSIWKDAAYLQWRYRDHPRYNYEMLTARCESDRSIIGLLVYRLAAIRDRPERVLRIVELIGTPSATAALTEEVCRVAHTSRAAFAEFYCTSERFARPLLDRGFVAESSMPQHLPALFEPLDSSRSALTGAFGVDRSIASDSRAFFDRDDVYFTRSDGDQDRPN